MADFRDLAPDEVADVLEIHDLLARYLRLNDTGGTDEYVELFTDDAEYVVHGRTYQGRAGVREMIGLAKPEGVHLASPPTVRVDGDKATAEQSFVAIMADRKNMRIGWYEDDLVKQDGRWRFASRRVTFVRSDGSLRLPR